MKSRDFDTVTKINNAGSNPSTTMSISDEDEYGTIAYEDLIEAFSQESQSLPLLTSTPPSKRRRIENDGPPSRRRRRSRGSIESEGPGDDEEENGRTKKNKHKIHFGNQEIPAARILGATQADALPDSSPYRIRGPIYMKPRLEPPKAPLAMVTQNSSNQSSFQREERHSFGNVSDPYLDEIPSDLLFEEPIRIGSSPLQEPRLISSSRQRPVAPSQGLRQTTLFGGRAPIEPSASQARKVNNYVVDMPPETPTQHALDQEALKTWVYPTNLGKIRDYQYSIVRNGLFHNTLVALPTGLGKTFIAATIMYNFHRWTKDAQIVFVAPTKPLVAQQVDACFNIVGIPKSQTTMLTGEQQPALRAEEWADKRVFFMTPQTLENDLSSGIADPKKIVLLVVDEAHRATGNYAYVKVVSFLRRFNKSFRVLALTATPGASVESVQEVIDSLEISKVEIRTEESIDIQQYVHRRDIDQIILDPSDEMIMVKELFAKSLQSLVNQLCSQNAYWNKDPMALTTFGMVQARKTWFASGAGRAASMGLKGMMHALFSTLASVAHAIKLLNFHGIGPFYSAVKEFRESGEGGKKGGGKYRKQILEHDDFKKMMDRIKGWINKDDFIGHPKLTYLCDTILNHFLDAGEGRLGEDAPPSNTRVIVFAEFRDSAEDITRVLNRHGPMIRASVFVGQADSKRSEGMNQAKQIETIARFKKGVVNVLVATSIGEEGLDIGQVDLIVCYDASGSPIRMLQRMGRTGRKRAGNIVLLLMRGKEEEAFAKAKDNYEQMQKMISSGARFNFRHDLSVRILPRDIVPEVEKRTIDIPLENTQDPSLPQPKRKRATTTKKKPPKKFHMPDGVETGFQKASNLTGKAVPSKDLSLSTKSNTPKPPNLAPIPSVDSVLLSARDLRELECRYQHVAGEDVQEVSMPELTCYPSDQRVLRPVVNVQHGGYTKKCVRLFQALARCQQLEDRHLKPYGSVEPIPQSWDVPALVENNHADNFRPAKRAALKKQKESSTHMMVLSDFDSDGESNSSAPQRRHQHEPTSTIFSTESEGQGDDLMDSEVPSIEDSDGESLEDFIVGTGAEKSPLVRSSTTPPPRAREVERKNLSTRPHKAFDLGLSDEESIGIAQSTNAEDILSSDVEMVSEYDENIRPVRGRQKRPRVVEESDSDE